MLNFKNSVQVKNKKMPENNKNNNLNFAHFM